MILFTFFGLLSYEASARQIQSFNLTLDSNASSLTSRDAYLCKSFKLPIQSYFVVAIDPHLDEDSVHHAILFSCPKSSVQSSIRRCNTMKEVCSSEGRIKVLYSTSFGGGSLKLPPLTGFRIDPSRILVVQFHYKGQKENSSSLLTVKVARDNDVKHEAGILAMAADEGMILANQAYLYTIISIFDQNFLNKISSDIQIRPIGYRVHGHSHGYKGYGYIVHQESEGQRWTLIGSRSIYINQSYQLISSNSKITKNDRIVAACSMFNYENRAVQIGPGMDDEMCNYYLLYMVDKGNDFESSLCGIFNETERTKLGSDKWIDESRVPWDAFDLPGNVGRFSCTEQAALGNNVAESEQDRKNEINFDDVEVLAISDIEKMDHFRCTDEFFDDAVCKYECICLPRKKEIFDVATTTETESKYIFIRNLSIDIFGLRTKEYGPACVRSEIELHCESEINVHNVWSALESKYGLDRHDFVLYYKRRQLSDTRATLTDLSIPNNAQFCCHRVRDDE
ncbi:hypothetical protein ACOME3_001263 [Neoechinorhynchus agilis]